MIVVVGDIMLDVMILPELREAEQESGVLMRPGGSAANTAAWLTTLGSEILFVGCVGHDPIGRMLVQNLQDRGARVHVRMTEGAESGAVVVQVTDTGERIMRSSRGANRLLSPEDIASAPADAASFVHLTGYTLLDPHGMAIVDAAGALARRLGARFTFDPSSIGVERAFGAHHLLSRLSRNGLSVLLPNAAEAESLVGRPNVEEAAQELGQWAPLVTVKDGAGGALAYEDGNAQRIATVPLLPLDTTGAGDAFNAGFLHCLEHGGTAVEACAAGNRVARQVICRYGGQPD
jgi:sugar/nucleoside kinase (ribokinase family)